jgi:aspartate/tyrosine/aromatic aminotransferase
LSTLAAPATCPLIPQEYQPIGGDPTFCSLSQQLAFGADCQARREGRIATVQTLSGTGALRIGAEYLAAWYPLKQVLLPNPTWGNHKAIFGAAGLRLGQYRYFDPSTKGLDYQVRDQGVGGGTGRG